MMLSEPSKHKVVAELHTGHKNQGLLGVSPSAEDPIGPTTYFTS